jgi:hypothetical protein
MARAATIKKRKTATKSKPAPKAPSEGPASAVEVCIAGLAPPQRALAEALVALVRSAAPKATVSIKWRMPVFEHHGLLCYVRPRPDYLTLGFYAQGTELSDPRGLLEGTGDRMRHVKVRSLKELPAADLTRMIRQAARINERA